MRWLFIALGSATAHSRATTEGTVSGELTLLDRAGAPRSDLAAAIAYLEPLDPQLRTQPSGPSDDASIVMRDREFMPHRAVIRAGGAVRFPNADPFSHNVFSNTDRFSFDLGLYRRGATRAATFERPGIYPIYCNIHARMVSYVIAVPDRYVAFADTDGRFAIANVPTGSYRLVVWHERAPLATQTITVTPGTVPVRITLDARGYQPGAHLNKFGVPYTVTRNDRY